LSLCGVVHLTKEGETFIRNKNHCGGGLTTKNFKLEDFEEVW